jgi:hypothetical protein
MKFKVVARLDEHKYKSCQDMDPKLWPMLKDKVYTLNVCSTLQWAKWSAKNHRDYPHSNLDASTVEIIKIND